MNHIVGLGTLSILRTEDCNGPRFLFRNIISTIIRLSLPPCSLMEDYIHRWKFSSDSEMLTFVHHLANTEMPFVDENNYEVSNN